MYMQMSIYQYINNRGAYYDPQNIFCGKYDCYKILGFDDEVWGRSPPSKKELTQSYRTMSKKWHPDKNRDKGAKDRFVVRAIYIYIYTYILTHTCLSILIIGLFYMQLSNIHTRHDDDSIYILLFFVSHFMFVPIHSFNYRKLTKHIKFLQIKKYAKNTITCVNVQTNTFTNTDHQLFTNMHQSQTQSSWYLFYYSP